MLYLRRALGGGIREHLQSVRPTGTEGFLFAAAFRGGCGGILFGNDVASFDSIVPPIGAFVASKINEAGCVPPDI